MKKSVILLTLLAAALMLFTACDPRVEESAWDRVNDYYSQILNAQSIEQNVEVFDVTASKIAVFKREKSITGTDDGFKEVVKDYTINTLDGETAYTEKEPVERMLAKAENPTPNVTFSAEYFNEDFVLAEDSFTGTLKDESITNFWNVDMGATPKNMTIKVTFDDKKVTKIEITFDLTDEKEKEYKVSINTEIGY